MVKQPRMIKVAEESREKKWYKVVKIIYLLDRTKAPHLHAAEGCWVVMEYLLES